MCCFQDPLVLAQLPEASRRSRPFYSKGLFYHFTWILLLSFLHAREKRIMPSAGRQGMDGLWMMEGGAARHDWYKERDRVVCTLRLCHIYRQDNRKLSTHPASAWWKSKIELVRQSSKGMAVQRGEQYCWDTGPQLHRLCKLDPTWAARSCAGLLSSAMDHHMGMGLRKDPSHPSGFDAWILLRLCKTASVPDMLLKVLHDSDLRSGKETLLSDEDLLLLSFSTLIATD